MINILSFMVNMIKTFLEIFLSQKDYIPFSI